MDKFTHVYKGSPPDHCVSDQALRQLPNGEWAIIFMTGGDHEPRKDNYIAMCRSKDQGSTWSIPETVLRFNDRACLLSEVIVHQKEIRIIVESHLGHFEDWQVYVLVSKDNGLTWSKPIPFTPMPHRAFLRNLYVSTWDEWFLPFQQYDIVKDVATSPMKDGAFKKARNGTLISADEGQTWTRSTDTGPTIGWAESNLVELSDGRMIMLIRDDHPLHLLFPGGTTTGRFGKQRKSTLEIGYLKRSESTDNGRTWSSPPEQTDIPNPSSKFRLHRLKTGQILLIHNPNPRPGDRNPLSLWISDDDMKTWNYKRILADFPGRLQYPDGFVDEKEGYLHFAFDYNRHDLVYCGAKLP